jgi:hypothetical protein
MQLHSWRAQLQICERLQHPSLLFSLQWHSELSLPRRIRRVGLEDEPWLALREVEEHLREVAVGLWLVSVRPILDIKEVDG